MTTSPSSTPAVVRRRRPWLIAAAVVAGAFLLWLGLGIRLFVFPTLDEIGTSDAIVVLGPAEQWRLDLADDLVEQGVSDTVLVTASSDALDDPYCASRPGVTVECMHPDPYTTQGEAGFARERALEQGWNSVTVITWTPHIERARHIFGGCLPSEVEQRFTGSHPPEGWRGWAYQFAYQTGGYLKSFFVTPGC